MEILPLVIPANTLNGYDVTGSNARMSEYGSPPPVFTQPVPLLVELTNPPSVPASKTDPVTVKHLMYLLGGPPVLVH